LLLPNRAAFLSLSSFEDEDRFLSPRAPRARNLFSLIVLSPSPPPLKEGIFPLHFHTSLSAWVGMRLPELVYAFPALTSFYFFGDPPMKDAGDNTLFRLEQVVFWRLW